MIILCVDFIEWLSENIIGDSRNYMPPILVPSSAKRITRQILVIAKLNGRKDFILRGFVCDIIRPSHALPVQSYNWNTRIRCANCSKLRTKTIERCQWRRCAYIVNCEHMSNFVLTADFEQANIYLVHIKKASTFEARSGPSCVML